MLRVRSDCHLISHVLNSSGAVEDPFSVLSALVPDTSCALLVTPLFPPPSQDSSHTNLPLPVNVPPPESPPVTPAPGSQATGSGKSKYHHWAITRPAPQRGKAKDPVEEQPPPPEWRKPRPPHTADFGLFPSFATSRSPDGTLEVLATQERLFGALYTSLENAVRPESSSASASANQLATAAQSWLQEVVYGGIDGLAYMRSVAEFVIPNPEAGGDQGVNAAIAGYVDAVLINELTEHRHRAIEAALTELGASGQQNSPRTTTASPPLPPPPPPLELPTQLDLGSLISAPNELFDAEKAWAGAGAKEDAAVLSRALDHASRLLEELHAQRTGAPVGAVGMMDVDYGVEEEEEEEEEEEGAGRDLETELRMNLIALAKRAPLDQIARMPPELVPPHLRRVVPTIGC
jgi:bromodomain-containing protein 7/9